MALHLLMGLILLLGFWYLLLTGVFLLVIPIVAGDIGIFSEIGKYLAIAGVVGVILTGIVTYLYVHMNLMHCLQG